MVAHHQERLTGFDSGPHANYRVVRKPLLSASTLASWFVCHTKPFVQRILERFGIEVTNAAMRRGALAHAEVQGALEAVAAPSELTFEEALATHRFLMGTEVHVLDERRRLHGFVDILFARHGGLHVLELKNSRPPRQSDPVWGLPVWPDHAVQVHLYGVVAEAQFGVPPHLSLSYLRDGSKEAVLDELSQGSAPERALERLVGASVPVPHGATERDRVLEEARAFQRAERAPEIPLPNHDDPRICAYCSVRAWCPRRLDLPGRFVALDERQLEERETHRQSNKIE